MDEIRALIVDDDPDFLKSVARRFRKDSQIALRTSSSPFEALHMLTEQDYAVVLCDWKMPGMGGEELLKVVGTSYPDIAKVLITGVADRFEIAQAVSELGLDSVLIKPVETDELRRRILEGARAQMARLARATKPTGTVTKLSTLLIRLVCGMDAPLGEHLRRTAALSLQLYDRSMRSVHGSKFNPKYHLEFRSTLHHASLLHDIGELFTSPKLETETGRSISTSEALLFDDVIEAVATVGTQPGQRQETTPEHVEISYRVACALPWEPHLQMVPFLCRHHHERLDGSGYPDGMSKKGNFPLPLRILSIADRFDSLTNPRFAGRERLAKYDALELLSEHAKDGQYDERLVDSLWEVVRSSHSGEQLRDGEHTREIEQLR